MSGRKASNARAYVMRALEQAVTLIIERMAREDHYTVPDEAREVLRSGMAKVSAGFDDGACERLALVPFDRLVADVRAMVEPDARRLCAPSRVS